MQAQTQRQVQGQTLKILPQQIQFLNLLHLNQQELESYIQQEIDENPFLEDNREAEQIPDGDLLASVPDDTPELQTAGEFDDPMNWGSLDDEMPSYQTHAEQGFEADEKWQAPAVQATTIREEIKEQCRFLRLSERQKMLVEYLIDSLDDTGYLRTPLETIVDDISFSQNIFVSDTEIEAALTLLQRLDPPGIGARNLRECLLIQLNRLEGVDVGLPHRLVSDYMEALAAHDYGAVMAELRVSADELHEALDFITSLNPRPLRGLGDAASAAPATIIPEYVVETDGTEHIVSLPTGLADAIRISADANQTLRSTRDKQALRFVQQKMQDARWLVEALQQRDDTMLRTMRTIVLMQRDFFQTGDFKKLKPMTLRDVAAFVDLTQSTISRVTSGKYVQTAFGIFPVKDLFTQTFTAQDGQEISNSDVMDCMKALVETEDKTAPLNDSQLCGLLAQQGFAIARRTVAKYRDLLHIPSADLRRAVA